MPLALLLNSRQKKVFQLLLLLIPYIIEQRASIVICLFLQKLLANAYALALGRPRLCSCSVYSTKIRDFYKAICKKPSAVHCSEREFDSKLRHFFLFFLPVLCLDAEFLMQTKTLENAVSILSKTFLGY